MNWSTLKALGYGGLIPFLALGAASQMIHDAQWQALLLKANAFYGASIVSFLGAIHWGLALGLHAANDPQCNCAADAERRNSDVQAPEWTSRELVWGIVPSLMAWAATTLLPPRDACAALVLCLITVWCVDTRLYSRMAALAQFLSLRTQLTLGAIVGLLMSSVA